MHITINQDARGRSVISAAFGDDSVERRFVNKAYDEDALFDLDAGSNSGQASLAAVWKVSGMGTDSRFVAGPTDAEWFAQHPCRDYRVRAAGPRLARFCVASRDGGECFVPYKAEIGPFDQSDEFAAHAIVAAAMVPPLETDGSTGDILPSFAANGLEARSEADELSAVFARAMAEG